MVDFFESYDDARTCERQIVLVPVLTPRFRRSPLYPLSGLKQLRTGWFGKRYTGELQGKWPMRNAGSGEGWVLLQANRTHDTQYNVDIISAFLSWCLYTREFYSVFSYNQRAVVSISNKFHIGVRCTCVPSVLHYLRLLLKLTLRRLMSYMYI